MYMDYEADDVRARGQMTETSAARRLRPTRWRTAPGDDERTAPSASTRRFRSAFRARRTASICGRVPATVPVPRVESLLTFDYDVSGRFSEPYITGGATFARSEFLGAHGRRRHGRIDRHAAEAAALHRRRRHRRYQPRRFGEGLDVAWLQRAALCRHVSGHFQVTAPEHDRNAGADRRRTADTGGTVQRHAVGRGRLDRHRPRDAARVVSTGGSPRSIRRCRSWIRGSSRR